MFTHNREQSNRKWAKYRQLGKLKFTLIFSIYFSLVLSLVNFLLEFAAYGYGSPYMAVIRFVTYLIVSPIMALIIWKVSESKYQNSLND